MAIMIMRVLLNFRVNVLNFILSNWKFISIEFYFHLKFCKFDSKIKRNHPKVFVMAEICFITAVLVSTSSQIVFSLLKVLEFSFKFWRLLNDLLEFVDFLRH